MITCAVKGLFITGTGTDVGKSIVTSALLRSFYKKEFPVLAVKPIQTGVNVNTVKEEGDVSLYISSLHGLDCCNKFTDLDVKCRIKTLHTFLLPASPHLASAEEYIRLNCKDLNEEIHQVYKDTIQECGINAPLILEGAGGVLVPINQEETTLDLVESLDIPVLIVMKNALGALNHILLTIDAIKQRGLNILGIVATESEERNPHDDLLLADNIDYLRQKTNVPVWELPYIEGLSNVNFFSQEGQVTAWETASNRLDELADCCIQFWNHQRDNNSSNNVSQSLLDWDTAHLWHPYTSSIEPLPVYEVTHTSGTRIYIKDKDAQFQERALIDGMSSWWCAIHGYGHPQLVNATVKQAQTMSHVMFGGLTHAPAVDCAKLLLSMLPAELTRLFWSDSGSVSVEVALKMALQYQKGKGHTSRNRVLTPMGGYHGDTMGAMSVCDPVNGMHGLFRGSVAEQVFISRPSCRFDAPFDPACTRELEQAFEEHGHSLAAVILEPIVQGAGGMWFYHPEYLRRVRELCTQHQALLIIDEIATGFGRTGKMFACEWAGITPDIMCVGKGLTGGFMSLAATICTDHVAENICANGNVFMHGPTFMGNPLACAVAKASLELLLASDWQENIARIEHCLKKGLGKCADFEDVADVRVLGAIGVIEMRNPVSMQNLQSFFVNKGVWIRPFGRLVYIMPPYVSTNDDIQMLCSAIFDALINKAYV